MHSIHLLLQKKRSRLFSLHEHRVTNIQKKKKKKLQRSSINYLPPSAQSRLDTYTTDKGISPLYSLISLSYYVMRASRRGEKMIYSCASVLTRGQWLFYAYTDGGKSAASYSYPPKKSPPCLLAADLGCKCG